MPYYFLIIRMFASASARSIALKIYFSASTCIYRNLAFERWLFERVKLANASVLLIWMSSPSVVIGRHQNPWLECDVEWLTKTDAQLARRYSGGGAVYHDRNNVNFCLMTSKSRHCRKGNMAVIKYLLEEKLHIPNVEISKRDDLFIRDSKLSGSAAKIDSRKSYHHFTMLVDHDISAMKAALRPSIDFVESKSLISTRSTVTSLRSCNCLIDTEQFIQLVADQFASVYDYVTSININPDDSYCSGLNEIEKELKSWEWIFGKSPKFVVKLNNGLVMTVDKGIISEINGGNVNDLSKLIGQRFSLHLYKSFLGSE